MTGADFRTLEAAGWSDKAEAYHRYARALTGWTIDEMLDAVELRDGMRVLDIGTGPGYVAASAAARGAGATGVDLADDMLALARRVHPHAEFRQADAEALPFDDDSFHAVVGNFVILHCSDPQRAAAEMLRVLKPHGKVALTAWQVPERARFFGAMLDAMQVAAPTDAPLLPPGPPIFRFADPEEFAELLEGVGFDEVAVRELPHVHAIGSVDEVWEFFTTASVRIGGLLRDQTPDMQQRIRVRLGKLLAAYATDAGLEIPADANLAIGRKA